MVHRSGQPVGRPTLDNSCREVSLSQGPITHPEPQWLRLAVERKLLKREKLSNKVIRTIQATRWPSTIRIYNATWKIFCDWCEKGHLDPTLASVADVLEFLQEDLERGLFPEHPAAPGCGLSLSSESVWF